MVCFCIECRIDWSRLATLEELYVFNLGTAFLIRLAFFLHNHVEVLSKPPCHIPAVYITNRYVRPL